VSRRFYQRTNLVLGNTVILIPIELSVADRVDYSIRAQMSLNGIYERVLCNRHVAAELLSSAKKEEEVEENILSEDERWLPALVCMYLCT